MSALDDPRVFVDTYVVRTTGYDKFVNGDRDTWCLSVVNGHRWGWSIQRGVGMSDGQVTMNRKGGWIREHRGSGHNKARRWPLEEALEIALKYVDVHTINGHTADEASRSVASRLGHQHVHLWQSGETL